MPNGGGNVQLIIGYLPSAVLVEPTMRNRPNHNLRKAAVIDTGISQWECLIYRCNIPGKTVQGSSLHRTVLMVFFDLPRMS